MDRRGYNGGTILGELAEAARARCADARRALPYELVRERAEQAAARQGEARFLFEKAFRGDGLSFICEVKKASPSKGIIAEDFPYLDIAQEYEAAGASAISVLTEPTRFLGSDKHLADIAESVRIPVLRKDFTVDSYQIFEAKALGASAVLLICALLSRSELDEYLSICRGLGMSALVEAHDEGEIETALNAGARIIGVNNRNLATFDVDAGLSARLRRLVPPDVLFVAESGVKSRADVARLEAAGADAVLVGEALMRSADKDGMLAYLSGRAELMPGAGAKENVGADEVMGKND
ncbi:MAG: indole-3-glycerol phosphate synthase TrpC [Clostridiales Family XIII bacterium]|jgi:indole-3-glycerol phosphate synthase|nr:indole-3-glycerol phosphate synthase TrpC [Clostridiales Family XIII bacterium]